MKTIIVNKTPVIILLTGAIAVNTFSFLNAIFQTVPLIPFDDRAIIQVLLTLTVAIGLTMTLITGIHRVKEKVDTFSRYTANSYIFLMLSKVIVTILRGVLGKELSIALTLLTLVSMLLTRLIYGLLVSPILREYTA